MASVPEGVQIAYAVIPTISHLPEPLRTQVRAAFADSIRLIWHVMIGISGLGFISCALMGEVPLQVSMDDSWGLKQKGESSGDSGEQGELD